MHHLCEFSWGNGIFEMGMAIKNAFAKKNETEGSASFGKERGGRMAMNVLPLRGEASGVLHAER